LVIRRESENNGDTLLDSFSFVAFNKAAEKLWGYASAETFGRSVGMLMPVTIAARHQSFVERYLETGATKVVGYGREVIMQKKNGDQCTVHLAVAESEEKGRRLFMAVVQPV
jgi:PAS domain S-box-containing protein